MIFYLMQSKGKRPVRANKLTHLFSLFKKYNPKENNPALTKFVLKSQPEREGVNDATNL